MTRRLFIVPMILIFILGLTSCQPTMRPPETPAETTVNLLMSVNNNDFNGFKNYLHDNLKTSVTLNDFNKFKAAVSSIRYSLDTYVIVEFENNEMYMFRFDNFKQNKKDVVVKIKKLPKDISQKIKEINQSRAMEIEIN